MAQFTMNAEITLKAKNAQASIDRFAKSAKNSKKEFSLFGRIVSLDTKRIEKNMIAMSAIMGTIFAGILLQSPAVRAEFKRLGAEVLLLNVALGEEMQPTLALFVDSLIFLINIFLQLPPPIQTVIGITILLTVTLLAAATAAVVLWTALGPITLAILGISAAIAILIVFGPQIVTLGGLIMNFSSVLVDSITNAMSIVSTAVFDFFEKFGLVGEIFATVIVSSIVMLTIFTKAIAGSLDLSFKLFGGFLTALAKLFSGDFGGFASALGNMFINVINAAIGVLNAFLILPLNIALRAIDKAAEVVGGDVDFRLTPIPLVGSFQEGGTIRQDGLIFGHRDEEVLRKSEARELRRGGGARGGITINNYNTFKIGSVDSKKRIREMMRESERMNKRNMDRRLKV